MRRKEVVIVVVVMAYGFMVFLVSDTPLSAFLCEDFFLGW